MLILTQSGDELINMQQVTTMSISHTRTSGVDQWHITAEIIGAHAYNSIGKYNTESDAKDALGRIYAGYNSNQKCVCMP